MRCKTSTLCHSHAGGSPAERRGTLTVPVRIPAQRSRNSTSSGRCLRVSKTSGSMPSSSTIALSARTAWSSHRPAAAISATVAEVQRLRTSRAAAGSRPADRRCVFAVRHLGPEQLRGDGAVLRAGEGDDGRFAVAPPRRPHRRRRRRFGEDALRFRRGARGGQQRAAKNGEHVGSRHPQTLNRGGTRTPSNGLPFASAIPAPCEVQCGRGRPRTTTPPNPRRYAGVHARIPAWRRNPCGPGGPRTPQRPVPAHPSVDAASGGGGGSTATRTTRQKLLGGEAEGVTLVLRSRLDRRGSSVTYAWRPSA